MPTVLLINGYRFHFYAKDMNEPCHIHVSKGSGYAKIWMEPTVEPAYFYKFKPQEQKVIMDLIKEHEREIKIKWNEYFSK